MLVVVGGHSRNIGKTSVMASVIAGTRHLRWAAVKITQFGHGVCSRDGEDCDCAVTDYTHPFALDQELSPGATDTGRFLAAGAAHAYWLRTAIGQLAEGMPALRGLMAQHPALIAESNSLLRFVKPDLYLFVLDPSQSDWKESAQLWVDRADALVITGPGSMPATVSSRLLAAKPRFPAPPPAYESPALVDFVRSRLV